MQKVAVKIKQIIESTKCYRTALKYLFNEPQFLSNTWSMNKIQEVNELVTFIRNQPSGNDDFWREKLVANLSDQQDSYDVNVKLCEDMEVELLNRPKLQRILNNIQESQAKEWIKFFKKNIDRVPIIWYSKILRLHRVGSQNDDFFKEIVKRTMDSGSWIPPDLLSCLFWHTHGHIEELRDFNLSCYENNHITERGFLLNLSTCSVLYDIEIKYVQNITDKAQFDEDMTRLILTIICKAPFEISKKARQRLIHFCQLNSDHYYVRILSLFYIRYEVWQLSLWSKLVSNIEVKNSKNLLKTILATTQLNKFPSEIVKQWMKIVWILLIRQENNQQSNIRKYLNSFYKKFQNKLNQENITSIIFNFDIQSDSWTKFFPIFNIQEEPQHSSQMFSMDMKPGQFLQKLKDINKNRDFTELEVTKIKQYISKKLDTFDLYELIKFKSQTFRIYNTLPKNINQVIKNRVSIKIMEENIPSASIYPFIRYFGAQNIDTELFMHLEDRIINIIPEFRMDKIEALMLSLRKSNRITPRILKAIMVELEKRQWGEQQGRVIKLLYQVNASFSLLQKKLQKIFRESTDHTVLECASRATLILMERKQKHLDNIVVPVKQPNFSTYYEVLLSFRGYRPFNIDHIKLINRRFPILASKTPHFLKFLNENINKIDLNNITNFLYLLPDFDPSRLQMRRPPESFRQFWLMVIALCKKQKKFVQRYIQMRRYLKKPYPLIEEYQELVKLMDQMPTETRDLLESQMFLFISDLEQLLRLTIENNGTFSWRFLEKFEI